MGEDVEREVESLALVIFVSRVLFYSCNSTPIMQSLTKRTLFIFIYILDILLPSVIERVIFTSVENLVKS